MEASKSSNSEEKIPQCGSKTTAGAGPNAEVVSQETTDSDTAPTNNPPAESAHQDSDNAAKKRPRSNHKTTMSEVGSDYVLKDSDIPHLVRCLTSISVKWQELGLSLHLPGSTKAECKGSTNILSLENVLTEWVAGQGLKPVTLGQLVKVLAGDIVGRGVLAETLISEFNKGLMEVAQPSHPASDIPCDPKASSGDCVSLISDTDKKEIQPGHEQPQPTLGSSTQLAKKISNSDFKKLDNFTTGKIIRLKGVAPDSGRFAVNIFNAHRPDDIIFHFNPRFDHKCVVRNSRIQGIWGVEERDGSMVFTPGEEFSLSIFVELKVFRVQVDGKFFCEYNHRYGVPNLVLLEFDCGVEYDCCEVP